jgi:hypothetical protein
VPCISGTVRGANSDTHITNAHAIPASLVCLLSPHHISQRSRYRSF